MVKGSNVGTASDKNGKFIIPVEIGDILVISFIGMKQQEIKIKDYKDLKITLEKKAKELDEIICTGIFDRKSNSYTGSTITIKNEELQRVGSQNVFQALKNIDPSLRIFENLDAGSNPNALPEIQLRGTSSIPSEQQGLDLKGNYLKSPNQPLFILDGFEVSLEKFFDMDMDRINSITILKDASAKALYGSKAANGVIVIETKKLISSKPRVSYKVNLDIQIPDLSSYDLCNASEKLEAEMIDGYYYSNDDSKADPSLSEQIYLDKLYQSRKRLVALGLDTDWLSKPLRTGIGQKHSLSVEIGEERLKFMGNFSYKETNGVMKGSNRETIDGNIFISYRTGNLNFKNSMGIVKTSNTNSKYGSFSEYSKMNPYWRATNPDGSIPYYAEQNDYYSVTNPLFNSKLNSKNESSYIQFINNFYIEWNILDKLKATSRIGVDMKRNYSDIFYPSAHTVFDNLTGADEVRKGSYQVNNGKGNRVSGDININYNKEIGKHFLFSNVGFNMYSEDYSELIHKVEGFPSDKMEHISFGKAYALDSRPQGIETVSHGLGFLGFLSYTYDNRFLSDITLRTNASSQFGSDKRWAKFWSLGLGWNIHNEQFLESIDGLKQFKLRGSVGSTGNQAFNTNYAIDKYNYYLASRYQGFIGSYLQNLANKELQWQSKFDYNIGFDASYDKLRLKFDYYEAYTKNLITDFTLPPSVGFESIKENIGEIKNTGYELSASYLAVNGKNGFLNLNLNIATNKNEIVKLSDALESYNARIDEIAADKGNNDPVHKFQDGISMTAIWAVRSLGIDPASGNEIYLNKKGERTEVWNSDDLVVCGDEEPDFIGNFGINGEYKGFGFNVSCRFKYGGQMYNNTLADRVENIDIVYNVDKRVLTGRWREPGQKTRFKRLGTYSNDENNDGVIDSSETGMEKTRLTSRFVQDNNILDISAVSLYYEFRKSFIKKFGMERMKLAFNMNELHRFSSIDIERGLSYPFSRTLSFSLNVTF